MHKFKNIITFTLQIIFLNAAMAIRMGRHIETTTKACEQAGLAVLYNVLFFKGPSRCIEQVDMPDSVSL